MKKTLFLLSLGFTAMAAVDAPPSIPGGQVTYDELSYQTPAANTLPAEFMPAAPAPAGYDSMTAPVLPPITPPPSSTPSTSINLHAYTTDYQVRGMGVTDRLSKYGASSVEFSHTFANRNLFNKGIQHRVEAMAGIIWDASCPLGDVPQFELGYFIGKEIFPNLMVEVGYHFRRGGFEGFMAKYYDNTSHRSAQDVALRITYNEHQKGLFGHAEWGWGFYGLTGCYFDVEMGYRFTDVLQGRRFGSDLEISGGIAPSISYWGSGVEGVDACRVKIALRPYSHGSVLGRDSHTQIKPWVQCSWTGNNARKIDRVTGAGPADHFQITFGLDVGWKF